MKPRYSLRVTRGTFKGDRWFFDTKKELRSWYKEMRDEKHTEPDGLIARGTVGIYDGRKKIGEL